MDGEWRERMGTVELVMGRGDQGDRGKVRGKKWER